MPPRSSARAAPPGEDDDNCYLPFVGQTHLREAAAAHVSRLSGVPYSGARKCVIAAGGLSGILNVLLATIEIGDEVIVTDPPMPGSSTACASPAACRVSCRSASRPARPGRSTATRCASSVGPKTRAMLLMSPSMPSGGYFDAEDWALVAKLCVAHDLLLILDTRDGAAAVRRPAA